MRDVAVVGAGMIDFGELYDQSFDDLIENAYIDLIENVDKGVDPEADIDAIWYGTRDLAEDGTSGASVAHATGLFETPATQIINACATGSDAFRHAVIGIQSGSVDVALVVGAEKMLDDTGGLITLAEKKRIWRGRGITMPAFFGLRATRHMELYGTTREQIAEVSVKNHANGVNYPHAHQQFTCSVEDVVDSPMVSEPLHLYECCPVTDGASALLVAGADVADTFTERPVTVTGYGLSTEGFQRTGDDALTHFPATRRAASTAYERADINPEDVDVAEVHDCFSISELIAYEDLGFCDVGDGGEFVAEGHTRLDGETPTNPSGGLLSKGHPIGATGVAQVAEIYDQLRGEAGDIQVENPEIGLQHNIGVGRDGTGSVGCVTVFERE
jgi:acetyl-CoA C-acetyltransferase